MDGVGDGELVHLLVFIGKVSLFAFIHGNDHYGYKQDHLEGQMYMLQVKFDFRLNFI